MAKRREYEEKNTPNNKEESKKKEHKDSVFPIPEEKIIEQVRSEYKQGLKAIQSTYDEWKRRLKLLANQRKNRKSVGDTLLFEIHQTVVASLYTDQLDSEWLPNGKDDEEIAENLNHLTRYDYRLMKKSRIDYDWIWDSAFFGYGIIFNTGFNVALKCPIFTVIDPMTYIHDPYATSINGDMDGSGKSRYMGHEIYMSADQIDNHKDFIIKSKEIDEENNPDTATIFKPGREARLEALGTDVSSSDVKGCNKEFALLEWFTHINGEIYLVVLADGMRKVARIRKIGDEFPIIKRDIYPTPHAFRGISIPDLVEDKQRARAVMMNTSMEAVKRNTYAMHFFDTNRVKAQDLSSYELDKFIPVDGNPQGVVDTMRKTQINSEVQWVLAELSNNAQSGTATPDIKQGAAMGIRRSATELGLMDKGSDTRYSLSAKVFGWSEREFWLLWYQNYKKYFKSGIIEKSISLRGPAGKTWITLNRDNIIAREDPDVDIVSKVVADSTRMREAQALNTVMMSIMQDPSSNKRYALKSLLRKVGMSIDEVDRIYPKTIDEVEANDENIQLSANKPQKVELTQDHQVHLLEHEKAEETQALKIHREAHMEAMKMARNKPELLAPQVQSQAIGMPGMPEGLPAGNMPIPTEGGFDVPKNIQTA